MYNFLRWNQADGRLQVSHRTSKHSRTFVVCWWDATIVHVLYLFPAFAPSTVPKKFLFLNVRVRCMAQLLLNCQRIHFFLGLVGSDSFLPEVFERPDITGPSQIWTQFVPPHSILYATRLHEYPSLYPPFRCCGL